MKLLEARGITKRYKNGNGISNFNIDIDKNDITLLLGPNGAGKTTAFKGMLGLLHLDKGESLIVENSIQEAPEKALKYVGAMISKPAFYEYLTGYENLKLLMTYYNNVDEFRINEVLELVELVDAKDNKVFTYSTGMKQRLDFARAIIHRPKVLILDEPFSGLDIEVKVAFKELINKMKNEGVGVVISSHMVGDLENFANRVLIIYEGQTLYGGTIEEIRDKGLTLEGFYIEKIKAYKNAA